NIAGLEREGWEVELGYRIPLSLGVVQSIQPAVRVSAIDNHFGGPGARSPAPSLWWDWRKFDAGVRVGLTRGLDVTLEYTFHDIVTPRLPLNQQEALVTVRGRI
ncbi:MAG TPA: hypothetical protein VE010_21700, partial [Thermoanaerobaculia bacterium]|nr:hypothetical protein [Thermoanaerobaculia bacterium]